MARAPNLSSVTILLRRSDAGGARGASIRLVASLGGSWTETPTPHLVLASSLRSHSPSKESKVATQCSQVGSCSTIRIDPGTS